MNPIKTIAVLQDLSGIGRCALSVALSVISAAGCQACAIPTALLGAHTAFPGVVPFDATEFVKRALREWDALGRSFDCVLTGYMPSPECVRAVLPFVERQRQNGAVTIVDPAMADHGKLYRALDPAIVGEYRLLSRHARMITPNVTEARLLTGVDGSYGEIMNGLLELSPSAVITGVEVSDGSRANMYMARGGELRMCPYEPYHVSFPGTGDLLAACLAAFVAKGVEPFESLKRATAFVSRAMELTIESKTPPVEGVQFERALGDLMPNPDAVIPS